MDTKRLKDIRAWATSFRPFHCVPENAELFERDREDAHAMVIDLLSLLDRQAVDYTRPTGWQDAMQRADPRRVFITFETRECAEAFMRGLQPAIGPTEAALAMREKCVDAIKSLRSTPHGAAYNNAINDAIHKVQSLTLDQVDQEKQQS